MFCSILGHSCALFNKCNKKGTKCGGRYRKCCDDLVCRPKGPMNSRAVSSAFLSPPYSFPFSHGTVGAKIIRMHRVFPCKQVMQNWGCGNKMHQIIPNMILWLKHNGSRVSYTFFTSRQYHIWNNLIRLVTTTLNLYNVFTWKKV